MPRLSGRFSLHLFTSPSPKAESVYAHLNNFLAPQGNLIFEAFSTKTSEWEVEALKQKVCASL